MANLLKETAKHVEEKGMDPIFVGFPDRGIGMSWDEFKRCADFEYDDGYGTHEIPLDLVVGWEDGSKLIRCEYDGSEWWEYIEPFKLPENCSWVPGSVSRLENEHSVIPEGSEVIALTRW